MLLSVRLLVLLCLFTTMGIAQSFTFAEMHPVTAVDSLEQWVDHHPQPSRGRLARLIQLERTYTWNRANKIGTHLEEIRQLVGNYKQVTAQAAYHYLKGYHFFHHSRHHSAVQHIKKSILAFHSVNDTSGLIHAYTLLVNMQYNSFGGTVTDQPFFKQVYKDELNRLVKQTANKDDELLAQRTKWSVMYSEARIGKRLEATAQEGLMTIRKDPSTRYALYQFAKYLAISYYYKNQYQQSYRQNKAILDSLSADQTDELITINYNLSNDCDKLNRFSERVLYTNKALALVKRFDPQNYAMLNILYNNNREIALRQGRFREALVLADSVLKYVNAALNQENRLGVLEQQSQFESERKQQQINNLKRQLHAAEQLREQTLLIIGVFVLILLLISYLLFRLRRVNDELQRLNKARERFFGIIAHDLRYPLHAFQDMNELVSYYLKTQRYGDVEKISLAIDSAGSKIQLMLDNLLRWARAQRQELPNQPQILLLRSRIEEVVGLFESLSSQYSVHYDVRCPTDLQVYADPNAIDLILRNLIDNALKAMHKQGGRLTIDAEAAERGQVRIRVADSGIGMTEAQLSKVRQVLQKPLNVQLDATNTGLGLILVSQFVQCNKGTISVESLTQEGTTFLLTFPKTVI